MKNYHFEMKYFTYAKAPAKPGKVKTYTVPHLYVYPYVRFEEGGFSRDACIFERLKIDKSVTCFQILHFVLDPEGFAKLVFPRS